MDPLTIIIASALAAVFIAIVTCGIINKKKGKSSCSSCSGCAMRGSCPSKK